MAEKLIAPVLNTGVTNPKFVLIRLSDGAYWNTSGTPAFEAYNASNIASYGIAGTQTGSTGIYTVTNPSPTTPAEFVFVSAAGSSMAVSDVAANILWQDFCGPRNSNVEYFGGSALSTSTAQIGVNVVNFGGSAGTFSSGRPEVNTTLIEGVDATDQLDTASGGGSSLTAADVWGYTTRTLTGGPSIITGDIEFTTKEIVRGNDYSSSNQPWSVSLADSSITDLSAYTWTFAASKDADNLNDGDASFTGTVSVTQATGSSRAVRIDIAATTTDSLAVGYYNGALRGTSSSRPATPIFFTVKVLDDPNQS